MTSSPLPSRPRLLPGWWWRAPLLLLLGGALLVGLLPDIGNDPSINTALGLLLLLLAVALYLVWLLVASGWSGRVRLGLLVGLILVGLLFPRLVVFRGFSGVMVPQFTWAWQAPPPPDALTVAEGAGTVILGPAQAFPQYLGPGRDGVVAGLPLASDWARKPPELLWMRQIGPGLAGFVAVGDRCVLLEQRDEHELTICYRLADGEPLWVHGETTRHGTTLGGIGPRSTPTVDGDRVYVLGATGRLLCLDLVDGTVHWRVDLFELLGTSQAEDEAAVAWGRSASPLLYEDLVIVPAGGPPGRRASLIAFDAATGAECWRGGDRQISYSSPMLVSFGDSEQILIANEASLAGHDPATGAELWRHPFPGSSRGNATGSQPIAWQDGRVFISKGYGHGSKMLQVEHHDGAWQVAELWHRPTHLRTKFSNPVPGEGRLFGLDERSLQAIDPADGAELWRGERYGHGQILRRGGQLLVLGERGSVALVDAANGQEQARFQAVAGKCWSTPCLAGDLLLVRSFSEAACWRLPVAAADP